MSTPAAPAATQDTQQTPPLEQKVQQQDPPKETPTAKRVASAFFKSFGIPEKEAEEKPKEEQPKADKPKEEKPKAGAPKEGEPSKPAEEKPKEEKPKIKKEKVIDEFDASRPTPQPKRDEKVDIKKIVKETVEGVIEAQKPQKAEKPEPVELPKPIARKAEALKVLEKEDPKYAGLSRQIEDFYKPKGLKEQYIEQWKKANPGKKFVEDDEEHDEFLSEHDPLAKISEDELEYARDLLVEQRVAEKASRVVNERFSKEQQKEAVQQAKQTAKQRLDGLAMEAIQEIAPDIAKDPERLRKLDEEDPLAEHILTGTIRSVAPIIETTSELFTGAEFDPKNPVHLQVEQYAEDLQSKLLAMGDRAKRGDREFVPIEQYAKLPAKDRSKAWTIGADDLIKYVSNLAKNHATSEYQRLTKGRKPVANSGHNGSEAQPKKAADAPAKTIESPTVSASTPAPPPGTAVSTAPTRPGEAFFKSFGVR